MGRVLTLPPLRFGLLAEREWPVGHGLVTRCVNERAVGVMGRVLTLPPLRFGLLARSQVACGHGLVTEESTKKGPGDSCPQDLFYRAN